MKCDELKVYKVYTTRNEGAFGFCEGADPTDIELEHKYVCLKSDVDRLLEKNDAEIADLKAKLEDVNELIKTARQMLEDVKASHYAEMVDAGMSERRLKRALYIAHEYKAKYKRWWLHFALDYEASMIRPDTKTINRIKGKIRNCEKSERKCLKKAEEYR